MNKEHLDQIREYLMQYDGPQLTLMEVCGSHTAAIAKYGIKGILSKKIKLISGPGCPVCVTPSAYIDRLIELALKPGNCVTTFGDLLRVPGSKSSLSAAKGEGAQVQMVYSPMDTIALAKEHPEINYIFAAVGFETTAPVYTILLEEAIKEGLTNLQILTALKTMPGAIAWLMENGAAIDGFLAPGHVCAITGSEYFEELAAQYGIPFAVSGFEAEQLLLAIYGLVKMAEKKNCEVKNFYPEVVEHDGNAVAMDRLQKFFKPADVAWRGMGEIPGSGLELREEYARFDAGSSGLTEDHKMNAACKCGEILMGKAESKDCPLYKKVCSPQHPQGACMVSYEGNCYQQYINGL